MVMVLPDRATPQGLDLRPKMEVVSKMSRRRGSGVGNPEGGELDPAVDIHRRCKKNSPSVLSCKGKRTKQGCELQLVVICVLDKVS